MCACVLVHVDKCSVIFTPVPGLISPQHICLPSFPNPPTIFIRIWGLANASVFSPEEKKKQSTYDATALYHCYSAGCYILRVTSGPRRSIAKQTKSQIKPLIGKHFVPQSSVLQLIWDSFIKQQLSLREWAL